MNKELIVAHNIKSSISESIKTIRTNINFSSIDKPINSLLITSTSMSEGKSFISSNLAIAFAQEDKKVLLVDCDLRKGRLHKIFNIQNDYGLSLLLTLELTDENINKTITHTEVKNLDVIPRGIVPPFPSEMLSSNKMKELYKKLLDKYDLIIFDGTPILGLADSIIMSNLVDKIVVVTCYKKTTTNKLNDTMESLSKFKDKIAGVILNQVPQKNGSYYYYYQEGK